MTTQPNTKTVPLIPGAQTPEGQARIDAAVHAMDDNARLCREILRDVLDEISPGSLPPDTHRAAKACIRAWALLSEEFIRAISGAPAQA